MGFFSGVCSAISSACSAVCSSVSSTFNSVRSVFRDVTETTFESFGRIMKAIGVILGIIRNDDSIESTGDKVLQAKEEGIVRERFTSFDEYKKAIDAFEVDPEKSKKMSKKDKEAAGISYVTLGTTEKFGQDVLPLLTTVGRNPDVYTVGKVMSYIETFKAAGISMEKIDAFYNNQLSKHEISNVKSLLLKSEINSGENIEIAKQLIDSQKI